LMPGMFVDIAEERRLKIEDRSSRRSSVIPAIQGNFWIPGRACYRQLARNDN
jgi:hypothetical protein